MKGYCKMHTQVHLEITKIPMTVLAIDSVGHLPKTSKGNRWVLTASCLHVSYMFASQMVENVLKK